MSNFNKAYFSGNDHPKLDLKYFKSKSGTDERREEIKDFSDFIDDNPDVEEEYMTNIRIISKRNARMLDELWTSMLTTITGAWASTGQKNPVWRVWWELL